MMDEVSSPQRHPEMFGCTLRILLCFPRMLVYLFCLLLSPLYLCHPQIGSACHLARSSSFRSLFFTFHSLLLLIVLPLLSLLLSLPLPSMPESLHVLWLDCLSPLLVETYFPLVHLPVGVLRVYVFLLLYLPQSYCVGIHLIYREVRCFYISIESG